MWLFWLSWLCAASTAAIAAILATAQVRDVARTTPVQAPKEATAGESART